jgi:hypothetical protein
VIFRPDVVDLDVLPFAGPLLFPAFVCFGESERLRLPRAVTFFKTATFFTVFLTVVFVVRWVALTDFRETTLALTTFPFLTCALTLFVEILVIRPRTTRFTLTLTTFPF